MMNKTERFSNRHNQYPVNNWLNDILGTRILLNSDEIKTIIENLDQWQDELSIKNWYYRQKDGYKGLHLYLNKKSNFYFPWELQIWDLNDVKNNIKNHEKFKRKFL